MTSRKTTEFNCKEFSDWLQRELIFESYEQIQIYQSVSKSLRGEMIFRRDFLPNFKFMKDGFAIFINEILAACQNDVDVINRASTYIVDLISNNHRQPLSRRIGPMIPKQVTVRPKKKSGVINECGEDASSSVNTNIKWIDVLFNGSLSQNSGVVLIYGEEGIGKSTLLWQTLCKLKVRTLYISSQQTNNDLMRQFKNCGSVPSDYMKIFHSTDRDSIMKEIRKYKPKVWVVDSLRAITGVKTNDGFEMASGTPMAVAKLADDFGSLSDELNSFGFLVGHENKNGTATSGSRIKHIVNGILQLKRYSKIDNDKRRILIPRDKFRFGDIKQGALFEFDKSGMVYKWPYRDKD